MTTCKKLLKVAAANPKAPKAEVRAATAAKRGRGLEKQVALAVKNRQLAQNLLLLAANKILVENIISQGMVTRHAFFCGNSRRVDDRRLFLCSSLLSCKQK